MIVDEPSEFQIIDNIDESPEESDSNTKTTVTVKEEILSPKDNSKDVNETESCQTKGGNTEKCKNHTSSETSEENNKITSSEQEESTPDIGKLKQPDCLIITEEEEDLDTSIEIKQDEETSKTVEEPSKPANKRSTDKAVKKSSPKSKKKESTKHIWVSNITREIKASDLKKHFSLHAKVTNAKIMTNGKGYFGYLCLESNEMAQKCANELNNTKISSTRIKVSLQRPDLKSSSSPEDVKRKLDFAIVKKKDEKTSIEPPKTVVSPKRNKRPIDNEKESENYQLQKRLKAAQADLMTCKKRLFDTQDDLRIKTERCRSLRKEMDRLTDQLHVERKRLEQDRNQFKEKQKMDQIRFDTDRTMLNKEIDECKKLREYLESKINELSDSRRRKAKSRSPVYRKSPPRGRNVRPAISRGRLDSSEKRGRFDSSKERNRTPPPAPKLSSEKALGRSQDPYSLSTKIKSSQQRHTSPGPARGHFIEPSRRNDNLAPRSMGAPLSSQSSRNPPWQANYPAPVWRQSGGYGDGFHQVPHGALPRENVFYPTFDKGHSGMDASGRRY